MENIETYEDKMRKLKEDMSPEEILNSDDVEINGCNFSADTIREETIDELKERGKVWNDIQIGILVEGLENSDWLKINFDYTDLWEEIDEWIDRLEEEWKESNEFGY